MKKKRLVSLVMATALLFGSAAALPDGVFSENTSITASAVTDGDWEYVVLDDDTISLTKYNGGGGTVTIPSSFEDKDVVSFGTIFKGNNNIAKVIIPDTVTNIADNAFNNCPNLTGVTIGSGVTNIGDNAFRECLGITSISFPEGLTSIGDYAFYNCCRIKRVRIPGSVNKIGKYAFAADGTFCSNKFDYVCEWHSLNSGTYWIKSMSINELVLEEGVKQIDEYAFYNCCFLKSVIIPKSISTLGKASVLCGIVGYDYDGLYCYKDSVGQVYAKNIGLKYVLLDVTKVDAKDPTCLEPGNKEYWVYNEDEYYTDNHATTMLDEDEIVIPATGHTWSDWETITKATCTTDGLKMRYCTACGKTEKPKIDKLGHDYIATVVEPTCTKQGYTEHKCSRCSDSYKDNIVAALGHDYVDTVVPPTCTTEGYTIHKCSRCNKQYTDSKTALTEHTPDEAVSENVKPASCTIDGSYEEVVYCKDCHKELSRTEKKINKYGHDYVWKNKVFDSKKNTISQTGKCSLCGDTTTRTTENAVARIAGSGRYETAAKISQASFDQAETVVLAYGLNYADALAGVSLATKLKAPILLTNTKSLDKTTLAEIKRLKAKNVIILGGTGAISAAVENSLKKEGLTTDRIFGASRFGTATAIAEKLSEKPTDIFFVFGGNYPDALSASAAAAAKNAPIIYLSTKGDLHPEHTSPSSKRQAASRTHTLSVARELSPTI